MIKITHYQRKKDAHFYSIERIFEDIRKKLNSDLSVNVATSRYPSQGFFRRVYNCFEALIRQSDINHITGDIHYLGCCLSKKRMLLTVHDCVMMTRLTGIRRYIYWLFWLWLPVKRASMVIAVSEATRDELVRYLRVEPNNIRVIHNGLSDEFIFSPKIFNHSLPILLQIGTGQNKNLENVINAIKGIKCQLMIIGSPTKQQVNLLEKNNINYLALSKLSRRQIIEQYQQADLVIFASTYEGFGMPIIEANAIGRPVVTSNRLPMTEVAGGAAVLVNPDDVDSIRAGIEKVLEDSEYRNELIMLGIKNAQRFSILDVTKQYEEIYRNLALSMTV